MMSGTVPNGRWWEQPVEHVVDSSQEEQPMRIETIIQASALAASALMILSIVVFV